MPAITFTVVAATDTLTAVAHGLTTGDRCRVRSVGGTLAAPLAPVVDVFAIRLTVDTLKLATTSALALAGTPIDITTAGTGTQTLEYGLPYCIPNVIAGAGTQVKSADANGTWASLVALYDLLTGQAQSVWSGVTLSGLAAAAAGTVWVSAAGGLQRGATGIVYSFNGAGGQPATGGGTVAAGAATGGSTQVVTQPVTFIKPIDGLQKGTVVTALRIKYIKSNTTATAFNVFTSTPTTDFLSYTVSGTTIFTITLAAPFTVIDNSTICLSVGSSVVGEQLVNIDVICNPS